MIPGLYSRTKALNRARIWSAFSAICLLTSTLVADEPGAHEFQRASNGALLSEDFVTCVRGVRKAIVRAAKESRSVGDQRTEVLVHAACTGCKLPPEHRARAILLALAISFDQSDMLRKSVMTARFWQSYESDDERKERLKVIGKPTMNNRQDTATHFFIGAGLTALTSPSASEASCILKEVADANGGSGFSFIDLGADLAGIIYAQELITANEIPKHYVEEFKIITFVPPFSDLREGIMIEELSEDFSVDSKRRFKAEVEKIRQRILGLPIYNKSHVTVSSQTDSSSDK